MCRFPPPLSSVPGWSDAEIEEEKLLGRLAEAMRRLSPREGVTDAMIEANAERILYWCRGRQVDERLRKKADRASEPSPGAAKQLKDIATASTKLLKRLKDADISVFLLWARAAADVDREEATQEWLQLKNLLEKTAERAKRAAVATETVLRYSPGRERRGRPPNEVALDTTIAAALAYEDLTGQRAERICDRVTGKPYGKFHEFLTEVFKALSIEASPDASNMRLQNELRRLTQKN
jgi:hypothetical protein